MTINILSHYLLAFGLATSSFADTKTICVGRFILDVPADADIIYGPARVPYLLGRLGHEGKKLDEVVAAKLAEVVASGAHRARGPLAKPNSMFGKVIKGAAPNQRIVFGASEGEGSFYGIYSIQRVGAGFHMYSTSAYGDEYRDSVKEINMVSPLLRPRLEGELPAEPGLCLDGAFLKSPPAEIYEAVSLGIRLRSHPDVRISIAMVKKDRKIDGDSVEARLAAAEKDARKSGAGEWYDRVKVFRRGQRTIGGWTGYEYLARKPSIGKVISSHEFAFFSHGELNNAMVPTLDIALDTGVEGNVASSTHPSISDEEALHLWNKVTASIRPRISQ